MKSLFVASLAIVGSATTANAYFPVQVQTSLTPQEVTFTVENIWAMPVVCQGQFFARTFSAPAGIWLPFQIGPIVAGTFGFATMTPPYVYNGDYFISIPMVNVGCGYL